MYKNSLKLKILFIFFVPALVIIYFSYTSVEQSYNNLKDSSTFKLSANITKIFSNLVYNIQIERGLGAGYIVSRDTQKDEQRQLLEQQFKKTDLAYKALLKIFLQHEKSENNQNKMICNKTRPLIKEVLDKIKDISLIREKILNSNISFDDEITYYTSINSKLILSISMLNNMLTNLNQNTQVIVLIEKLKEYAGLERAYIYNQLLSSTYKQLYIDKLKRLKDQQETLLNEFFLTASEKSISIYLKYFKPEIITQLNLCRVGVFNNIFTFKDANKCFNISSKYIDIYKNISIHTLNNFIDNANNVYRESINYLIITVILWFLSFFALIFLSYLLMKFINNEYKNLEELRIASYAFDAQEAMAVTNKEGDFVKINTAFTKITGYSEEEVLGKNPKILQSGLHDSKFFKDMWDTLREENKWHGEIYNKRKNGEIYPELLSITAIKNNKNAITHYIAQFFDISEMKKAQELAQHQADHDFLTGLLNRKSLLERLNEELIKAKRHNFVHAFLFIDLDNFKSINDHFGHSIGDKLIMDVAKRLKAVLREGDIVARISGDEFAVILLNLNTQEAEAAKTIKSICEKILKAIATKTNIDEHTIKISSSIGIKIFPDTESSINDIIIHADKAMYEAKKMGKNRFIFFNQNIELELKKFAILESDIKTSLSNNDFRFFYQPKVDVNTGTIKGAEMLIRWQHPSKGLLYPNSFIDAAESMGVIHQFSIQALQNACRFLYTYKDIYEGTLAINISSKELLHPDFEQEITSIILQYSICPSKIELEITESMIIKEFDLVVDKIKSLQKFGIKFSIDDFGTGYSSITYLQKLPVNTLKIDRSFFHNLESDANKELVKMVIKIAKTFNMEVVSEGIEDEIQLNFIQEYGSHLYQGFYFSKAVSEDEFLQLIHNNK